MQSDVRNSVPRLQARALSHRFGARQVLAGLELDVFPGEIVGLLGPNGSGKSTAMQIMLGLLKPTDGQVSFEGAHVTPHDHAWRAHVGVAFQSASLDGKLTARENLRLGARLYGLPVAHAEERIESMLAWAELNARGDEQVQTWSGGMRRRLELARVLLHRPRLLLLDEPSSGLDETSFRRLWSRVETLVKDDGMSVLVTTHRSEEAERCHRLYVMDGGKVLAQGTPDALREQVFGDVIALRGEDPEALVSAIKQALNLDARIVGDDVVVEHTRGHELIPRLVEAVGPSRLSAVSMRRPTLGDVFVKLTGRVLGDEVSA